METKSFTAEKEFYSKAELVDTKTILKDDFNIMPYNEKSVVVHLPEGPKIVNFCSKVYGLVKNDEIFPKIEELLSEKFQFTKQYRHQNHCVFWADYTLQGRNVFIGEAKFKDDVQPVIRIMHSYNGSVKYRAVMGYRRQICTNGLWGHVFETQVDLRHSQGNLIKIFQKTIEGVENFVEQAKEFKVIYDDMSDRLVTNLEERIELIVNSTNFPKRQKDVVIERAKIEHQTHGLPISDWLIYNAFNYQLNHNKDFSEDEAWRMKMDNEILKIINNGVRDGNKLVLA